MDKKQCSSKKQIISKKTRGFLMKITEIKCKSALSKSNLPGLDYSLNPYRGCQHKCAYCYVPNVLRIRRDEWGNFVNVKTNIPNILSKELRNKKIGTVGISTVTDPYQPVEKKYKLTRYCLEQLLRVDYDLISKFSKVEVMISIATLNDNERKLLEPNSSTIQERLNVLKKYNGAGIKTSIFFGPIYPTIKLGDMPSIIDTFIEHGAKEIMIDGFNLKPGIWRNIELVMHNDLGIFEIFSKNIKNKEYYIQIRDELINYSRKRKVKIVDAF
jgi:DNA repair photolyase